MESKDKIDLLHKEADIMDKQSNILYKKIFILIAFIGGLSTIILKAEVSENIINFSITMIFIVSIGLFFIYLKLSKLNKEINNTLNEFKRMKNDR